ncbi:MAG: winged helix-turn-helix domain-containing protein [Lysinibacillus sp.]
MDTIHFSPKDFTIHYHIHKITFLPKEYQLFRYLYQYPNIVFSREELLNAVWPMEAPIDRTVDDHIYRVRKKLVPLSDVVSIETVRGQGYVLVKQLVQQSPLVHDQEISSHVSQLFYKYHRYGQGDALKLLQQNQQLLGFEFELPNLLYLHFMQGDFRWFLETPINFWDKCFYLLHIYALVEPDKANCLHYFTRAFEHKEMPDYQRLEIRLLNRILLLILANQLEQAEHELQLAKHEIFREDYEGFMPLILLTECTLALAKLDEPRIDQLLQDIQQTLKQFPFLREHANFLVVQGIAALRSDEEQAEHYFNEGFRILHDSQFVPGLLMNSYLILFFIDLWKLSTSLKSYYEKKFHDLLEAYQLQALHKQIEQILPKYL